MSKINKLGICELLDMKVKDIFEICEKNCGVDQCYKGCPFKDDNDGCPVYELKNFVTNENFIEDF